jgi:hypothetical protein
LNQIVIQPLPCDDEHINDPPKLVTKGRPKLKKAAANLSSQPSPSKVTKRSRHCRICKGTNHTARTCPVKHNDNSDNQEKCSVLNVDNADIESESSDISVMSVEKSASDIEMQDSFEESLPKPQLAPQFRVPSPSQPSISEFSEANTGVSTTEEEFSDQDDNLITHLESE